MDQVEAPKSEFQTSNERWFDTALSPELRRLAQHCEERGMAFVAAAEYTQGRYGGVSMLPAGSGLYMVMLSNLVNNSNIDEFFTGLLAYCKQAGIDYSQSQVLTLIEREASYQQEAEALQAKLDRLMLEFCPDEMTEEQKARWAAHQRPVSAEVAAAIDEAAAGGVVVESPTAGVVVVG